MIIAITYKQWKKNKTNTENVTTYFHVTICHFFWHWHYLAKSCDTQMGTNKKRKKETENKNDMDRKIKFLCHVLLLPLMPI